MAISKVVASVDLKWGCVAHAVHHTTLKGRFSERLALGKSTFRRDDSRLCDLLSLTFMLQSDRLLTVKQPHKSL